MKKVTLPNYHITYETLLNLGFSEDAALKLISAIKEETQDGNLDIDVGSNERIRALYAQLEKESETKGS